MSAEASSQEIDAFKRDCEAWFSAHKPASPDFMVPQTFMEVGTQQQFDFLRRWQRKVYEAGYLGIAWPKEYGGGGGAQIFQDIATGVMAQAFNADYG